MCDKCSGTVEQCLEMSREVDRFNRKAHAEKVRNFYRDQGREQEQQRIIRLLINEAIQLRSMNLNIHAENYDDAIALIKEEESNE